MLSPNRQWSVFTIVMLAGMMILSGCATRKYVRNQVSTLNPAIQEVTNATKENAERIDAVDRRAQQGITAAGAADTKATQAQQAAQAANTAAQTAQRQADTANQAVQQASNRINTVETKLNNLDVTDNFTAADTQTLTFPVNSSVLSDQAKSTLDRIATQATGQRTGYMIELQGFTDNTGSENYNIGLSQRRAESTLRYLVTKNIPLFRISIVGLGEEKPVADNKTRQGRDQNRRVEVRLLRSVSAGTTN